MSNLYRGPSIDASYQVSIHLAEGFQRRRLKCEKLTDDGRRTPSDGKSSHCLWQGELKKMQGDNLPGGGIHGHNGLDVETIVHLYKICISPVLLYGLELILPTTSFLLLLKNFQKKNPEANTIVTDMRG
jgi:hypothetical protein